jgi:hypothetical protein
MSAIVLLDAGPLGMISNPKATAVNTAGYKWMKALEPQKAIGSQTQQRQVQRRQRPERRS